jgi:hypothetical protein
MAYPTWDANLNDAGVVINPIKEEHGDLCCIHDATQLIPPSVLIVSF